MARSWNEQLLLNLVRLRYLDTPQFIQVGTIVSQYSITGSAGANPTVNIDGTTRNEYGFILGLSYTETPTVTYQTLQGADYAQKILTPISLETIVLLSQSGWSLERLLFCCAQKINQLKNAPGAAGPTLSHAIPESEFLRLCQLLQSLQVSGTIELLLEETEKGKEAILQINPPVENQGKGEIEEVKRLLNLNTGENRFRLIAASKQKEPNEIAVALRSYLGILFFLSRGVEIPEEDRMADRVTPSKDAKGNPIDWTELKEKVMRIRSNRDGLENVFVAVAYRDNWFYIDDSDLNSKATFSLLGFLFSLQSTGASQDKLGLTLQAGR